MHTRRAFLGGIFSIAGTMSVSGQESLRIDLNQNLADLSAPRNMDDNIARSRSMATRTVDAMEQIAKSYAMGIKGIASMKEAIERGDQTVADLEEQRKKAVADLRNGYFCSRCGKSKTEIEQNGNENFQDHVVRVGGNIIPASAEHIRKKEEEFEQKISQSNKEQQKRRSNLASAQIRQEDYLNQFQAGAQLWNSSVEHEKWLIEFEQDRYQSHYKREQEAAENTLKRLNKDIQNMTDHDPKKKDALASKARWEGILKESRRQEESRQFIYQDKLKKSSEYTAYDYRRLREATNLISPSSTDFNRLIPNFKLSAPSSVGRISVSTTPDAIGIKFQMYKVVSIGLETKFNRDESSMEVVAFFDVMNKIRIHAGQRTDFTPNGAFTSPTIGITPQQDATTPQGLREYKIDIPNAPKPVILRQLPKL